MTAEVKALIERFDHLRDSGVCSPTTRGLLDDAEALLTALSTPPADDVREAAAKTPYMLGPDESMQHGYANAVSQMPGCETTSGEAMRTFATWLAEHDKRVRAESPATPPADDVREALDGDVKALMGRLWAAADNAGVSREAVEFEWPECHKPKCQGSHGLPDVAMSYMKRAIMAEIEAELRHRLTTRPDHAPKTDSLEQAAAFNLAILLSNHNVHDEGTFIRAAERIIEAYPELVPALSGREVRPYGTVTEPTNEQVLAGLNAEGPASAAAPSLDFYAAGNIARMRNVLRAAGEARS